jgi:endogenous inhibitor of DNA gyrase (YacG/DUF329 family)
MAEFTCDREKIYCDERKVPLQVICNILNFLETKNWYGSDSKPSNNIDFTKYKCECCGKEEYGHSGSWNQDPYLFFCSIKCHNIWDEKRMADNNELDPCPICELNKMTYVGRANSYFCYGCGKWYDPDFVLGEYE